MPRNSTILAIGAGIIAVVVFVGLIVIKPAKEQVYVSPSPTEVVRQYFESWNNKAWADMYATISDGFKRIEPTAKDLASFSAYASSQGIDGVRILEITELSNNGKSATVGYSVEFLLTNGNKKPFKGEFTLKYREGDIIPGWKLIHPYGEKIDTS